MNAKQSHGRPIKLLNCRKDGNSRYFIEDVAASDSKLPDPRIGGSSHGGTESSDSVTRHDKSSIWQQSINNQRLFPEVLQAHRASGLNSLIYESPLTDTVGYFFGSASPDSLG